MEIQRLYTGLVEAAEVACEIVLISLGLRSAHNPVPCKSITHSPGSRVSFALE